MKRKMLRSAVRTTEGFDPETGFFSFSALSENTPRPTTDRRQEVCGVPVSHNAYLVWHRLSGSHEACSQSDAEIGLEACRMKPLTAAQVAAAIEELAATDLLTVEERNGTRFLNTLTKTTSGLW